MTNAKPAVIVVNDGGEFLSMGCISVRARIGERLRKGARLRTVIRAGRRLQQAFSRRDGDPDRSKLGKS